MKILIFDKKTTLEYKYVGFIILFLIALFLTRT